MIFTNTRTVLLWHNNGEERISFPVNPASLTVTRPNRNRVLPLAMGGTVNVWAGRGLREVRLVTFLPAENSPFFHGTAPETMLDRLKRWQDSGDPVRLILSDSDINDAFLIEDVREILREGDRDVGVAIFLREYKFKSALAALAGPHASPGQTPTRPDERGKPRTYTVRRGDTLWDIACHLYDNGGRWREIADKNGVTDPRKLSVGKVLRL